jgi:hypothetical protein
MVQGSVINLAGLLLVSDTLKIIIEFTVIGGLKSRGLTKGPPTVGTKKISLVEILTIPR